MFQNDYRIKECSYSNAFNIPPGGTALMPQILINSGLTPQVNQPFALMTIQENIIPLVVTISVFDTINNKHIFSLGTPFWQSSGVFKDNLIQSQYAQSSLVAFDTLVVGGGDKQFLLDLNQIDLDSSYMNIQQNLALNFSQNFFDTLDIIPFQYPGLPAGSYNLSYTFTYFAAL